MAVPAQSRPSVPRHLARYGVPQEYAEYTPRDHAVWRHILRRLTAHLADRAHPSYLDGLAACGIGLERIPSLEAMNAQLAGLGWAAMAVRGFIPPAVFTELQSRGVLAIAADIRSHEHVAYTPAPDIVHESAGHAPILKDPRYAAYLRRCGLAGFKAIASREDQAVYEAVRQLSVVEADPAATPADLDRARRRLGRARGRGRPSESTRASRLYWWTAEYGLVGTLDQPRIYGAGLLSSLGEASHCLSPAVARLPLSLACVDQDFDITHMQPQLYVARDFEHLFEVLAAFEATLAWKRGGDYGLVQALRAGTVNHLVLADGLEVTGRVVRLVPAPPRTAARGGPPPGAEASAGSAPMAASPGAGSTPAGMTTRLAVLEGPILLSRAGICTLAAPWPGPAVVVFGPEPRRGPFRCELPGGFSLAGERTTEHQGTALQATWRGRPLGLPADALLLFSSGLPSVAGGPGDPEAWDLWFGAAPVGDGEAVARRHKAEALPEGLARLYREVARMRDAGPDPDRLRQIRSELARYPEDWLLDCEIQELQELLELLDPSPAAGTGRGETGESWAPWELRGPFATQNA